MPRHAITVSQKASLRAYHESNPALDHKTLRQWFCQQYNQNISLSSVSEILSARYQSIAHPKYGRRLLSAKRRRVERWPLVEAILQEWLEGENGQTTITADLLREKAQEVFRQIPEYRGMTLPKFSNSWILGFRARYAASSHISEYGMHGSNNTTPDENDNRLRHVLSAYPPQDQYLFLETTLYWKMLPESALTRVPIRRLEETRTRIAALLCTNIDGSHRLPPWYIGRNPNPRAFQSAVGGCVQSLGTIWRYNALAKVTRTIFREFLHWLDGSLGDRKVVLLMDIPFVQRFVFPRSQSPDSRSFGLKNITIICPPTSLMDSYNKLRQAVTGIWKTFYRRYWVQYVYNLLNAHKNPLTTMNVLKAISWACVAWYNDMDPRFLQSCSRKFGWLEISAGDPAGDPAEEDESRYQTAKQQLRAIVRELEQMGFLHSAMEIHTFISPPFESSEATWIEEEKMATQSSSVEIPEGDSDEELPTSRSTSSLRVLA